MTLFSLLNYTNWKRTIIENGKTFDRIESEIGTKTVLCNASVNVTKTK